MTISGLEQDQRVAELPDLSKVVELVTFLRNQRSAVLVRYKPEQAAPITDKINEVIELILEQQAKIEAAAGSLEHVIAMLGELSIDLPDKPGGSI